MVSRQPTHDQYATGLACGVVTDAFGKDPGLICRAMLSHGSRTLRETVHESVRAVLYRSRFLRFIYVRPSLEVAPESMSACTSYPHPAQCCLCNVGGANHSSLSKRLNTFTLADMSHEVIPFH